VRWTVLDTPIGALSVGADEVGVCHVRFGPVETALVSPDDGRGTPDNGWLAAAVAELRAYFTGELTAFTVPVHVRQGSEFERAVWAQMSTIPYGETRTYGDIAAAVGDPGAARAVGMACNRNPIPVIVPCHRVVGANRKLVGYGGGLPRKVFLLELEARVQLTAGGLCSG
jgi:methylated-DNA-[protein]-cysteine S-methyltransferase